MKIIGAFNKIPTLTGMDFKKKRKILVILIASLFCLLFARGMELHMKKSISLDRIRVHAMPTAISVLYHHHPHDYTGIRSIAMSFQGDGNPQHLIKAAIKQDTSQEKDLYYWAADDKGLEDYVIAAFSLFGPRVESLYYLWFLILFASSTLFVISFKRQLSALGFLCLTLLGIHIALSTLPLCKLDLANLNVPAISIYEPRILDILALPAVIHLLFLAVRRGKLSWMKKILPGMGQLFILIMLYHSRSSLGWEIVSVFLFCLAIIAWRLYRVGQKQSRVGASLKAGVKPAFTVLALLILSLVSLNLYKHEVYNPRYFVDQGERTIWHNALMGLGQEDHYFATKYNLAVNDRTIAQSVIDFAKTSKSCSADIANLEAVQVLSACGGHGEINWYNYEHCAKSYFFTIASDNKLRTVFLYGLKKPSVSFHNFLNWMKRLSSEDIKAVGGGTGLGWHPFNALNLSFLGLILLFSFQPLYKSRRRLLLMIGILLLCSLIPSVAFYQSLVTQGGMLVITAILVYLVFIMLLRRVLGSLNKMPFYAKLAFQKKDIF